MLSPYLTEDSLNFSLLYVGGVMVTVSLRELMPEALGLEPKAAGLGTVVGGGVMMLSLLVFGG